MGELRGPARRWGFRLLTVVAAWVLVEALCLLLLSLSTGTWWSPRRGAAARAVAIGGAPAGEDLEGAAELGAVAPHPYFGYVRDPDRGASRFWATRPDGFLRRKDADLSSAPDALEIGVFGGSVANIMALSSGDVITERFAGELGPRAQAFSIRSYAMGGYKQPQQLSILAYLFAVGQAPDIVVDLDGFNELVLPQHDNAPASVFPAYPSNWHELAAGLPDVEAQRIAAELAAERRSRVDLVALFGSAPLRWSAAASLVWSRLDARHQARVRSLQQALSAIAASQDGFRLHGPPFADRGDRAVRDFAVATWERASRAMDALCRAQGVVYLHLLQPNQYVPGSKPLDPREREIAVVTGHPNAVTVPDGYPLLQAAGRRLAESGVAFYDLTGLFAETTARRYSDDCCHLNRAGNRELAAAVAEAALREWRRQRPER